MSINDGWDDRPEYVKPEDDEPIEEPGIPASHVEPALEPTDYDPSWEDPGYERGSHWEESE